MGIVCLAEPRSSVRNGIEHRLQVMWGPRDNRDHLRGSRLVVKRLLQIAFTALHCFEKPRVLDGDDGLVGECLEQFNLAIRKRANLGTPDGNRAYCLARMN